LCRDLLPGFQNPEQLLHHLVEGMRELESERYDFQRAKALYEDASLDHLSRERQQIQAERRELENARARRKELAKDALDKGFAHLSGPVRDDFIRFYNAFVEEFQKEQLQV
jgi:hypothetical protein